MTKVALLWHMHQPYYEDLLTGEHILPWVRLHALKDYYGMVALLREFPDVRVTFNLVPSLLVQIEAFAENRARDRHRELGMKPADQLTDEERQFILEHFFYAQKARMIDPYPRYAELNRKRLLQAQGSPRAFTEAELRDLQVWQKLAWIDESYKTGDDRVRALVAKQRGYTEEDKGLLLTIAHELVGRVIPEYRAACERNQVELSTSPFYHPILPLLCDTDVYLRTHPQSRMPRQRFQRPEDAREHLRRAVMLHERLFGSRPVGLWPSEGSVSEAIVPLVAETGFSWMASDEVILARTLNVPLTRDGAGHLEQPETLYRPYRVSIGGHDVACLFRDHTLSDLIGFTYSNWDAEAAAADFVGRLVEAGRRFSARTGGEEAVVPVILDGENAWEHFEASGRRFLRALYRRLATTPEVRTVTCAEACTAPTIRPLSKLFPGSWINGDFYIWIGHADDHRAWSQLADARTALDQADPALDPASLEQAREEVLIAEGSDWFWWYGDDHSSENDPDFDDLFRRHLRNAYRGLGKPVPEELYVTNITTQPRTDVWAPTGFIHPILDGEVSSYFEWIGAGVWEPKSTAGTMQAAQTHQGLISAIYFGFDLSTLFVRVDASRPLRQLLAEEAELSIRFLQPRGHRLIVRQTAGATAAVLMRRREDGLWSAGPDIIRASAGDVLEVGIPFAALGLLSGDTIALTVAISRDGAEVERQPGAQAIETTVPTEDFQRLNWTV